MGWKIDAEKIELIVELFAPGRVRFHEKDEIAPLLKRKREVLLEQASEDPSAWQALSALADKYRPTSLYADGRVRLNEEVAVFLGYAPPERPYLYVRAWTGYQEVMTLERRNELLADFGPEVGP